ncbi:double-CXXCG motif protein [Myxococcus sp. K15C18031901]|uniref:SitI6 family double-CXXCG motif immunity protein n=1 Tax=Myxococcus dinghuensis TaxID=2906761 RepID=UPI0020A756E4|nr:double-CXXCG motif protein [Myxococcus dinghuensis]MCP3097494.1 double-CXXCG motif protein [Myxococcus dinghuensis]
MRRFFWVDEDDAVVARYGGWVEAAHRWGLPGLKGCPTCLLTWSSTGHDYPGIDLSLIPEHHEFERARPEPFPEFSRLRELVRPLAPPNAWLPPGTGFGPLEGKSAGRLPDFIWMTSVLLAHQEALERLQATGVRGMTGHPTAVKFRQKPAPALREVQLEHRGALHPDCIPVETPPPCPTCGRHGFSRPDEPVLAAAILPTELDLFRLGNFATMLIATERFVDAVRALELEGLTFRELPTR